MLHIVPFFLGDDVGLLKTLAQELSSFFNISVRVDVPHFDPEDAYDLSRGQYNSRVLLARLLGHEAEEHDKVLGITGVDLFVPVLTYVFGEAQLDGRVAIISLYRLHPERYGLSANPKRLADRTLKEAVHELGHAFGLVHCRNSRCVMRSSTYVEEIDIKSVPFCSRCKRTLKNG